MSSSLLDKVEKDLESNNITVRVSKYCDACSVVCKEQKGILISLSEEKDADDLERGLCSSDYAWKLAHEISHLDNYQETMYSPLDGIRTRKDKERLNEICAIKKFIKPDELIDAMILFRESKDAADYLNIPLSVFYKAWKLYEETSDYFRSRINEILNEQI